MPRRFRIYHYDTQFFYCLLQQNDNWENVILIAFTFRLYLIFKPIYFRNFSVQLMYVGSHRTALHVCFPTEGAQGSDEQALEQENI